MRFVFVDRVVSAEPRRSIETLKNVSAAEDVFADHFPGYPVFPGALVIEAFAQASQLLIDMSHDFTAVGRLHGLSRVAFGRLVRPGDQLAIRCERRPVEGAWVFDASATVDGPQTETARRAECLRAFARELQRSPGEATRAGDE